MAIVTGSASGIVVLDVDPRHGGEKSLAALEAQHQKVPPTREVRTGGGGRQLYLAPAPAQVVRNSAGKVGPGLDVRGNGGYVIAPPSRHKSGKLYEWMNTLDPAPLPDWLAALISEPPKSAAPSTAEPEKIGGGHRNDYLTRLGGSMRRHGATFEALEAALLAENAARCEPPLPEAEVRKIAGSVVRYDPAQDLDQLIAELTEKSSKEVRHVVLEQIAKEPDPTERGRLLRRVSKRTEIPVTDLRESVKFYRRAQAGPHTEHFDASASRPPIDLAFREKVRGMVLEQEVERFDRLRQVASFIESGLRDRGRFLRTTDGRAFFFHSVDRRLYELDHTDFQHVVTMLSGLSATENFFQFAVDVLQAKIGREAPVTQVHSFSYFDSTSGLLAVSDSGSGIWFREPSDKWQFRHNGDEGLLFLTDPEASAWVPDFEKKGGAIEWFLSQFLFSSVPFSLQQCSLLLLVWLLQQFFPPLRRTRVIPCFLGGQGSGKTTAERLVARLLLGPGFDVSGVERDGEDDFVAAVTNRVVLGLDNADSGIPWLANALALYATGQRYQRRKLYTTNENVSYLPRAILMISSRDPRFNRPDVTERLLPLFFERPPKFLNEDEIFGPLESRRGAIMGALLTRASVCADRLASTPPKALRFRMADYSTFGQRISGGSEMEWLSLLGRLERAQAAFASEGDGLVAALREVLLRDGQVWEMPVGELFKICRAIADGESLPLARTASGFGRHLSSMRRVVELELGVKFTERDGHRGRLVTLVPFEDPAKNTGEGGGKWGCLRNCSESESGKILTRRLFARNRLQRQHRQRCLPPLLALRAMLGEKFPAAKNRSEQARQP